LEEELTPIQLNEWVEFSNREPFGVDIDFLGHAIVAASVINMSPNRGKKAKAISPKDLIPKFDRPVVTKKKLKEKVENDLGLDSARIRRDLEAAFKNRIVYAKK